MNCKTNSQWEQIQLRNMASFCMAMTCRAITSTPPPTHPRDPGGAVKALLCVEAQRPPSSESLKPSVQFPFTNEAAAAARPSVWLRRSLSVRRCTSPISAAAAAASQFGVTQTPLSSPLTGNREPDGMFLRVICGGIRKGIKRLEFCLMQEVNVLKADYS